jgi:hypothetical protein
VVTTTDGLDGIELGHADKGVVAEGREGHAEPVVRGRELAGGRKGLGVS